MPQPPKYDPLYDFVTFQAGSPTTPLPANKLRDELDAISTTTGATIDRLALIQRDDGAIKNQAVTPDALRRASSSSTARLVAAVSGAGGGFFVSKQFVDPNAFDPVSIFQPDLTGLLLPLATAPTADDGEPGDHAYSDDDGGLWYKTSAEDWTRIGTIEDLDPTGVVLSDDGLPASDPLDDGDVYVNLATQTRYARFDSEWIRVGSSDALLAGVYDELHETLSDEISEENENLYQPKSSNLSTWANVAPGPGWTNAIKDDLHDDWGTVFPLPIVPTDLRRVGVRFDGSDDSAAFSDAIGSNRKLILPPGTTVLSAAIVKSSISNLTIEGCGEGVSTIQLAGGATFTNSPLAFTNPTNVKMSGFTFDANNNASLSSGARPLLYIGGGNTIRLREIRAAHLKYIGFALVDTDTAWLDDLVYDFDTAVNTTTYGVNVSSISGVSKNIKARGVRGVRAGNIFVGSDIDITGFNVQGHKYGAGIVTGGGDGTSTYGRYSVIGCDVLSGVGIDNDGFDVGGFELGGFDVQAIANKAMQNGGPGFAVLSNGAIIALNHANGNGVNGSGSDGRRAGFRASYSDSTVGAHKASFIGNIAKDIGGSKQLYGYYEDGAGLTGIKLDANKFAGNIAAPTFIQGSGGDYNLAEWTAWTPTVTATSGTITTLGTVIAFYRRRGRTIEFFVSATITTNGSGATKINITLPFAPTRTGPVYGRDNGATGKALVGVLQGAGSMDVQFYDGTYPGANGAAIAMAGSYEFAG